MRNHGETYSIHFIKWPNIRFCYWKGFLVGLRNFRESLVDTLDGYYAHRVYEIPIFVRRYFIFEIIEQDKPHCLSNYRSLQNSGFSVSCVPS